MVWDLILRCHVMKSQQTYPSEMSHNTPLGTYVTWVNEHNTQLPADCRESHDNVTVMIAVQECLVVGHFFCFLHLLVRSCFVSGAFSFSRERQGCADAKARTISCDAQRYAARRASAGMRLMLPLVCGFHKHNTGYDSCPSHKTRSQTTNRIADRIWNGPRDK